MEEESQTVTQVIEMPIEGLPPQDEVPTLIVTMESTIIERPAPEEAP